MDPLLDERIVLTVMRSFSEFLKNSLRVSADKEAYGPSKNEGLCYESCQRIAFKGDLNGALYFCMDGYTKLKLLPRIASVFQIDPRLKGMADSVLLEFSNQLAARIIEELIDGGFRVEIDVPENLNHKLVPIDAKRYRQYIVIFFIRDRRAQQYLGRIYVVLTMEKYGDSAPASADESELAAASPSAPAGDQGEA